MRPMALLALMSLTALAFAGCADDTEGEGDPTTSSSSSSSSSSSPTTFTSSATSTTGSSSSTSTGPGANQAPTGAISVSVNGTNATFTLSGSDPDGDTIAWDLELGDGATESGTTLPATVNHTYAAGNYTANFTITDGTDPTTYDVAVAVGGGGAAAPGQTVTGSYVAGTPVDCAFGYLPELADVTYVTFAVEPATLGKPFVADFETTVPALALLVDFFDSAGTYVGTEEFPPAPEPGATQNTGTVPETAVSGFLSSCGGGQVSVTYVAG